MGERHGLEALCERDGGCSGHALGFAERASCPLGPGPSGPCSPRNQPSGHSLIARPPVAASCPHRLYPLDVPRAKSLGTRPHQIVTTSRPEEPRSTGCEGSTPRSVSASATSSARPGGRQSRRRVTSTSSAKLA